MLKRFREEEILGKPLTEQQNREIAGAQSAPDEDIDTFVPISMIDRYPGGLITEPIPPHPPINNPYPMPIPNACRENYKFAKSMPPAS